MQNPYSLGAKAALIDSSQNKLSALIIQVIAWSVVVFAIAIAPIAQGHGYHDDRHSHFTQPDGTVVDLVFHGSDYYARTETADGYTVVFDPATTAYYYAALNADGTEFLKTPHQAGKADPKGLGLPKGLQLKPEARAAKIAKKREEMEAVLKDREKWEALKVAKRNYQSFKKEVKKQEKEGKKGFAIPMGTIFPDSEIPDAPQMAEGDGGTGGGAEPAPPNFTLTEDVVGLTILVDFSDVPGTAVTQAQVDDWANKPGYTGFSNAGSVYDYFYVQSNGRLRYSNNVTYYVRVPNPKTYYDIKTQDSGLCGRALLNDALDVLIADGYDFSPLTTKTGGRIRACNVFFAGGDSGVWAKGLWPHRWVLSPQKEVAPGMYVYDYQITDIGTATDLKIGTFLHENGHMLLGYPDFYSYDGNAAVIGNFSLMASGNHAGSGRHPTNLDSYMKEASGWMDVVDLTSSSNQRCTVQVDGNLVYRYANPSNAQDYFMWEVRDNTGWEGPRGGASTSVNPATGLLTWHVLETGSNTYSSIFTPSGTDGSVPAGKTVRDFSKPYELLVVEANPLALNSYMNYWYENPTPGSNDAYRAADKSQISDATSPALKFWDTTGNTGRTVTSNCEIHSISADGPSMTFIVGNGAPSGSPVVSVSRNNIYTSTNSGTNAPTETFNICNAQGGTLNYTITTSAAWLSCDVASGSATTETDTVTVTFNTTGEAAGDKIGYIYVNDGSVNTTITVYLTVFAQPTLAVDSNSLSVGGIAGYQSDPVSFDLSNVGGGSCNYSISKSQPWLSLSHTTGSLVLEDDRVEVTCDATSLTPGVYNDTITITSAETSNPSLTVSVSFSVASSDMVVTSPNGGESFPGGAPQTITWVSTLGGSVNIDLYKGGSLARNIASAETNDGSFIWNVPFGLNGTDYRIRITSVQQGTKVDTSDGDFAISSCSSFETGLDGWVQDGTDDIDWTRQSGTTTSSSTGPTLASDGSYYLYVEASSPNFPAKTANIYKDVNFAGINQPLMTFDYHMYGSSMGTLYVEVSTNEGSTWVSPAAWSLTGDQGNAWVTGQVVDLGSYGGQTVRVRFRGVTGDNYFSDMAIDNVCFSEGLTSGVQFANGGSFSVSEAGGTATISVERTGDTSSSLSVNYATSNGSATSGSDYNSTSGQLNWSAGDADPKTFSVTIINDTSHETLQETVTLTLSNAVGGSITGSNPGTLSIVDNDNNAPTVYAGADKMITMSDALPWTPADLGVARWYDANDASTITHSGGAVSQWNDKSGNSNHATQTNSALRPTTGSRTVNGKNIIEFPNTNSQCLNISAIDVIGKEVWAVFMVDDYTTSTSQLLLGAGGNVQIGVNSSTQNMRLWSASGPYSADTKSTTTIPQSTATVAGWLAHTTTKKFSINGSLQTTTDNYVSGAMSAQQIGRGQYAVFDGSIGELIITNGTLSPDDRQKMEGYLAHKWGLQANLPGTHPYKDTAPGSPTAVVTITDASVTDSDGDSTTAEWSFVSGPAAVVFDDATAVNTSVTFTDEGTYTLRLTGDDTRDQASDDIVITVSPATTDRTVTYEGNENTSGSPPVDSNSPYQANDTVTVLGNTGSLVKTGYTFTGWNTAANGSGSSYNANDTFTITTNTILYAQWSANSYTVTFNKQGGSGGSNSVSATYGAAMPSANAPTRTGYLFDGYFTGVDGSGTKYYDASMNSSKNWDLTANTTLYAKWIATYTVTFQTDGTTGSSLTGSALQVVTSGGDCTAVTANSPAGYHFVNWTKSGSNYSSNNPLTITNVTEDMTIVANFALNPSISIADDGSIAEAAENGEVIQVTCSNGTFANPISASNWTVTGLPAGVSKGAVNRLSDTVITITLSGNRTTDYDSDITGVTVSCTAAEIDAYASGLSANSGVTLTATNDAESIEIVDDGWIEESSEDGELITVILSGGTFSTSLNASNWTVSNLPAGVNKGSVTRVSADIVTIALSGNRSTSYGGSDITNVTVSCTTAEYADSSGGSSLSDSNGVTLRALGGDTLMLQDGLNGYSGTTDTFIYKAATTTNYEGSTTIDLNSQANQERHGFIRFDLTGIPAGATITAASLDLTAGGGNTGVINVFDVTNSWTASTTTWNSASTIVGSTAYGSATISNSTLGAAVPTITLSPSIIQGWVDTPSTNNGFGIKTTYSNGAAANFLNICSDDHATASYRPKLTVTYESGGNGPEITVQGQGITINSGDTTPVSADGTAFGSTSVDGSTIVKSFTIQNDGDASLTLLGTPVVRVTGAHASEFVVNPMPSSSVTAGNSTSFNVTFTPNGGGLRTATISIDSDDGDEGTYTFAVSGYGILADNFTSWISGFEVGGDTGFNADPDGDGLVNGLENYFGTDPSNNSVGMLADSPNISAGTFTFSHPINSTPSSDITAVYKWSKDLTTFYADGATDPEGTSVSFAQGVPSDGRVGVTATITGSNKEKVFVQISVSRAVN